jgi:hypothetical protein
MRLGSFHSCKDLDFVSILKMEAIHFSETEVIVEQNYFQHHEIYYKETEGLEIGSPPPQLCLRKHIYNFLHLQHNQIMNTLNKCHVQRHFHFVDDIVIIYRTGTIIMMKH